MARGSKSGSASGSAANLGFEATLWATADKLRGHMDAGDYKHTVLGLIFLKYISDVFEEKHAALAGDKSSDPEDRDEYLAENIFWVPKDARWTMLQASATQPTIGRLLDDAMVAIEKIAGTYHAWRGKHPSPSGRRAGVEGGAVYRNISGFCMGAKIEDIRKHGHVLTPGRYVGAEEVEDDGEPFDEKMKRLTELLEEQFSESAKLEKVIRKNLSGLGLKLGSGA